MNDKLGLDEDEVVRSGPILLPASGKPLLIAYAGSELAKLQRQPVSYFQTLQSQRPDKHALERIDGHQHFSILEELASPTGALALAAARLTAVRCPNCGRPAPHRHLLAIQYAAFLAGFLGNAAT